MISFATRQGRRDVAHPGGGSPDMGGVSADGKVLWLSGRYNGEVYAISTRDGPAARADPRRQRARTASASGRSPGRYSLGHTGILR